METVVVGAGGLDPPTDCEPPNVTPDDKFWLRPFWIEVQMQSGGNWMVDEASGDGGNADYQVTHVHKCGVGTQAGSGQQSVAVFSTVKRVQDFEQF